jgi:hypothetical protein
MTEPDQNDVANNDTTPAEPVENAPDEVAVPDTEQTDPESAAEVVEPEPETVANPEDVTTFEEDDDPESLVGDEVE